MRPRTASPTRRAPARARRSPARSRAPAARWPAAARLRRTGHPEPIADGELAEAQTFPYFRVYWVGPQLRSATRSPPPTGRGLHQLGRRQRLLRRLRARAKGIFGGGSCLLPLQVTTVIYRLHSNAALGPQRNMVVRGVPGDRLRRRALDRALQRARGDRRLLRHLRPRLRRRAASCARSTPPARPPATLPPPVYCPGLSGPQTAAAAARDGTPARPRLPARRGRARVRRPTRASGDAERRAARAPRRPAAGAAACRSRGAG